MYTKTLLLALGFSLLAGVATAQDRFSAYDEACISSPTKDGQTESRSGFQVTYYCDRTFTQGQGNQIATLPANTLDACIEHCHANAECAATQWLFNAAAGQECRLFSVGDESGTSTLLGPVIMILTREATEDAQDIDTPSDDYSTGELNECRTSLSVCTRRFEIAQEELEQCRASQGNAEEENRLRTQLETCLDSRLEARRELTACQAANDNLLTIISICPGQNGKSLRQGRGTFKFSCEAKRTGEVLKNTGHGFEMCHQACAKDPQCGAINYWPVKPLVERCEMFKSSPRPGYTGKAASEKVVGAFLMARH